MSHYEIGSSDYEHRGVKVRSIVGNEQADNFIARIDLLNLADGFIPPGYEHRPDLISNLFYSSPAYFWYIALTSNLPDAFEDFVVGKRIKIPNE